MMYLRYGIYLISALTMQLLGYVLAPLLALLSDEDGWLPGWLWWFQTPDYPITGNFDWLTYYWQWRKKLPSSLENYVGKVGWLWRNNTKGFDENVIGYQLKKSRTMYKYTSAGNENVSDGPYTPGWVFRKLKPVDGSSIFQLYVILPTFKSKCLRLGFGWKIWANAPYLVGERVQFFFTANPFKSREDHG